MRESLFFVLDHACNAADRFEQLGIRLAHFFGYELRHFKQERPLQAEHSSVPHGAANDLAQNVAATIVRGNHAVADQERRGAAVVGQDAQRGIGSRDPCRRACRIARWRNTMSGRKMSVS